MENDKQKTIRMCGLVRVSTKKQSEVEFGSPEQQRAALKRWAKEQTERTGICYELKDEDIFEEDVSGRANSAHKRKKLHEARQGIRSGKYRALIFERVDRMGRAQDLNRAIVYEAAEHNCEVFEQESGQINLKDRGSRLSFNIKNIMAEEYSLDLEEKIPKKQREARVNNGKDTSTCPVLGLDAHPTRAGFYIKNDEELKIVRDILEKFCEVQSYLHTAEYCNEMGYRTKARMVKEKIVKGQKVPARAVGNEPFTPKRVRKLVTSNKLRGTGVFKDTWNQFPRLQDENGFVRWHYAHGPVFDDDIFDRVDAVIKKIENKRPRKTKNREIYLLSGILKLPDGSTFYGTSPKGRRYHYYYSKKSGDRIPCDLLDEIVCQRAKEYLRDTELLSTVVRSAFKTLGTDDNALDARIAKARDEVKAAAKLIERLSDSLRAAARDPEVDLAKVAALLSDEKERANTEYLNAQQKLEDLQAQKVQVTAAVSGRTMEV